MPPTSLDRYLRHRRAIEAALWTLFYLVQATANSATVQMDIDRVQLGFEEWEPVVWEFSSNLVLLALLPLLLWVDRRWPLYPGRWRRSLPWHLLASVAYSVAHVVLMVGLRELAYRSLGGDYHFGDWTREFLYEYLKDVRSYFAVLGVVYLYRFVLLRLQGEARLLGTPDEGPPAEPVDRPERLLVRKLGKEFLVAVAEVERLEAAENYVNLHVRGHVYPLRSTMAQIERRLDPAVFVRVHRSHIVNLNYLKAIEPLESGDARLLMADATRVPCSRRYRQPLRAVSGAPVA